MWPTFHTIVDSVFPPSEDELLARTCTEDSLLQLYQPTVRNGVTILLPYQEPTVQALIHLAKFQYQQRSYRLLAHILIHHLQLAATAPHYLVPIPLSRKRWRERGYNQVEEVARRAAPALSTSTLSPTLLQRSRHTRPQTELNRTARLTNIVGAFRCQPIKPAPPAIIILDDVCTTGSTLGAAHAACTQAYPDIPIIRLALAG